MIEQISGFDATEPEIPELYSRWIHENGDTYFVHDVTNSEASGEARRAEYPVRVSYTRERDGSRWSKDVAGFLAKRKPLPPTKSILPMKLRLEFAANASCTCMTNSSVIDYHSNECRYRVMMEASDIFQKLENLGFNL